MTDVEPYHEIWNILYYLYFLGGDFISTRGFSMYYSGSIILQGNEYIPFNNEITSWAMSGSDYLIQYNEVTKLFSIPYASENDYYVSWQTEILTTQTNFPIIGLEFKYDNILRNDYIICPLATVQIENSSLYHISTASTPDILTIGLKVIGNETSYTLSCPSQYKYAASIIILGI